MKGTTLIKTQSVPHPRGFTAGQKSESWLKACEASGVAIQGRCVLQQRGLVGASESPRVGLALRPVHAEEGGGEERVETGKG